MKKSVGIAFFALTVASFSMLRPKFGLQKFFSKGRVVPLNNVDADEKSGQFQNEKSQILSEDQCMVGHNPGILTKTGPRTANRSFGKKKKVYHWAVLLNVSEKKQVSRGWARAFDGCCSQVLPGFLEKNFYKNQKIKQVISMRHSKPVPSVFSLPGGNSPAAPTTAANTSTTTANKKKLALPPPPPPQHHNNTPSAPPLSVDLTAGFTPIPDWLFSPLPVDPTPCENENLDDEPLPPHPDTSVLENQDSSFPPPPTPEELSVMAGFPPPPTAEELSVMAGFPPLPTAEELNTMANFPPPPPIAEELDAMKQADSIPSSPTPKSPLPPPTAAPPPFLPVNPVLPAGASSNVLKPSNLNAQRSAEKLLQQIREGKRLKKVQSSDKKDSSKPLPKNRTNLDPVADILSAAMQQQGVFDNKNDSDSDSQQNNALSTSDQTMFEENDFSDDGQMEPANPQSKSEKEKNDKLFAKFEQNRKEREAKKNQDQENPGAPELKQMIPHKLSEETQKKRNNLFSKIKTAGKEIGGSIVDGIRQFGQKKNKLREVDPNKPHPAQKMEEERPPNLNKLLSSSVGDIRKAVGSSDDEDSDNTEDGGSRRSQEGAATTEDDDQGLFKRRSEHP